MENIKDYIIYYEILGISTNWPNLYYGGNYFEEKSVKHFKNMFWNENRIDDGSNMFFYVGFYSYEKKNFYDKVLCGLTDHGSDHTNREWRLYTIPKNINNHSVSRNDFIWNLIKSFRRNGK